MEKENKVFSARVIAEIAIMTAIAFGLDYLAGGLWRGVFTNGGSIGLAMIPILILCYRRGFVPGLICGVILAFLQLLGGFYSIASTWYNVMFQVALDYILAYPVVALAGLFYKPFQKETTLKGKIKWVVIGTVVGGFAKFLCHYLSGVIYWPSTELGGPLVYSLVYNGAYMLPNIIICGAVLILLVTRFPKQFTLVQAEPVTSEEGEEKNEETSNN